MRTLVLVLAALLLGCDTTPIHHAVPEQRCPYPAWTLERLGVDKDDLSCYGTTRADGMWDHPAGRHTRRSA